MAAILRVAHGPLAVEALLLGDVANRSRAAARDPTALSRTLTIVVPSESLRLHVSAQIIASRSRSVAGVRVTTLHGFAARVLDRAGAPAARGSAWFAILVRRLARTEPALARDLEPFENGLDAAVASVADFFDAGFEPSHAEPLLEVLSDRELAPRVSARTIERARALVRVASAAARELRLLDAEHRSGVLARAARAIDSDPALLTEGEVWIRGFADATGRASDLIECVARAPLARVYIDTSTIPPHAGETGASFGQRLRDRLGIAEQPDSTTTPTPALVRAPGVEAEVRAVAERIRLLIGRGVRPESIGVVSRDLGPLRLAVRRTFTRMGVPFSALGARGSPGPAQRRVEATFAVLRASERASVERWLDAHASADSDVLLALRTVGVARLRALAELQLEHLPLRNGALPLAVRRGSWSGGDDAITRALARRSVPRAALERARDDARTFLDMLERWPARTSFTDHRERLHALVSQALHWDADTPGATELDGVQDELAREIGASGSLDRPEFMRVALDTWRERCAFPLGGMGGGVQVLSVVEARARTFEHLFVVSLDRGLFPRPVREDPLLPDALRRSLGVILPDLPLKSLGHEEERTLFEELVRSSPSVTLSWQTMDEDGRARQASPYVEPYSSTRAELARAVFDPAECPQAQLRRPAHEQLVLAALAGRHTRYLRLLPIAFADVCARVGGTPPAPGALARSTAAILTELDTPAHVRPGLTPYLGLVGASHSASDPRARELYVTTLEQLADCGWRTFLERLLQVEPPPDPLESLPTIDARLLGTLVHNALHAIVSAGAAPLSGSLAQAAERTPRTIAWPTARALHALCVSLATELLREEGFALPGFAHVLASEAHAYLETARALDAREEGFGVCGTEVDGALELAAGRRLRFRADRVERSARGLRLTDFKTGGAFSKAKKAATRDEHLTANIASGRLLQAMAYALAAGEEGQGRYAYLSPDVAEDARTPSVRSDDAARAAAFAGAVTTVLDAFAAGAFVPRLLDDKLEREHRHCATCAVGDACSRNDSSVRARLVDWAQRGDASAADPALRLWHIARSGDDES